jgi:hypothetical protein
VAVGGGAAGPAGLMQFVPGASLADGEVLYQQRQARISFLPMHALYTFPEYPPSYNNHKLREAACFGFDRNPGPPVDYNNWYEQRRERICHNCSCCVHTASGCPPDRAHVQIPDREPAQIPDRGHPQIGRTPDDHALWCQLDADVRIGDPRMRGNEELRVGNLIGEGNALIDVNEYNNEDSSMGEAQREVVDRIR